MMKLFTSILLLLSFSGVSQEALDTVFIRYNKANSDVLEYTTDTVLFQSEMTRNMILGTSIWPSSSNQYNAYWEYGIYFKDVKLSKCIGQTDENNKFKTGITDILVTDSTWVFKKVISGNCCHSFICDIKINDDLVLELLEFGYGTNHCDCACLYELTYTLQKIDFDRSKNIKSVMIDGDKKTKKDIFKPK